MSNPFDVSSGGNEKKWNYSDSQKPGYMTSISGTVVELERMQSTNFKTKEKEWWQNENPANWDAEKHSYITKPITASKLVPNGQIANPVVSFKFTIRGQSGRELEWVIDPRSIGQDAVVKALDGDTDISKLLGKWVTISTPGMTAGKAGGQARVWEVQNMGDGDVAAVRGTKDTCPDPFMPMNQSGPPSGYNPPPQQQQYQQAPPQQAQGNPYGQQQQAPPAQPQGNPYGQQQQAAPSVNDSPPNEEQYYPEVTVYDEDIPF